MNRKDKTEEYAINGTICLLIFIAALLVCSSAIAQEQKKDNLFDKLYSELLQYSTVYVAGDASNAYETSSPSYFVRTNPDNLYAVPQVIDNTIYHPFDYRIGIGIRKLARFDYEIKDKHYYDGTENTKALSSPTAAVKGFEYLLHFEKERRRSEEFTNSRIFIRHTGKNHIAKLEQREQGISGFNYKSGEIRFRLPIGKKLSLSLGGIYRTHQRPYGYNPIEIWLNETDSDGYPINPWYTLGFYYGYDDIYYTQEDQFGNEVTDWYWIDSEGAVVAYTDIDFRDRIFGHLMNRYNQEKWEELESFGEIAPIVGADFYHHSRKFWMHSFVNWILPYHKYIKGNDEFSYLNRDNWGLGGLRQDSKPKQWSDIQAGTIMGWKVSKTFGLFIEGEYTKFWDSEIFQTSVGLNIRL